jgi:hypothetical protein
MDVPPYVAHAWRSHMPSITDTEIRALLPIVKDRAGQLPSLVHAYRAGRRAAQPLPPALAGFSPCPNCLSVNVSTLTPVRSGMIVARCADCRCLFHADTGEPFVIDTLPGCSPASPGFAVPRTGTATMTTRQPRSAATAEGNPPECRPAGGATAAQPAGRPSPAGAQEPASPPTGGDASRIGDPLHESESSVTHPGNCTMFCDCQTARRVAGGTAAVRAGTPDGAAPRTVREAVQRAEDEHRTTTRRRDTR